MSNARKISLRPLEFNEAVSDLLKVKPAPKKAAKKRPNKRKRPQ